MKVKVMYKKVFQCKKFHFGEIFFTDYKLDVSGALLLISIIVFFFYIYIAITFFLIIRSYIGGLKKGETGEGEEDNEGCVSFAG